MKRTTLNEFSAKELYQARVRLNLTQEEAARKLDVSFPTYSRWENGHTLPSGRNLQLIRALLLKRR